MTGHDLDPAIGPALEAADKEELHIMRMMVAAIMKNFSSRGRSNLVRVAVFNCSLIRLISCTEERHRIGSIDPNSVDDELLGLKDLETALREGHPLRSNEAAFIAAFTSLEEWLLSVSARAADVAGEYRYIEIALLQSAIQTSLAMILEHESVAGTGSLYTEFWDERGVKAGFRNSVKVKIEGIVLSLLCVS
jgi:hypothetical protein